MAVGAPGPHNHGGNSLGGGPYAFTLAPKNPES